MKVLYYLGHPAHYHLFKNINALLNEKGGSSIVLIKTKDVLENLLKGDNVPYLNIYEKERKSGKLNVALSIVEKVRTLVKVVKQHKPDFLLGSTAELSIVGKLLGIPSIIFFEDDFEQVKPFAKIAGPLATHLVCPSSCSAWKWEKKALKYPGYHELAYLHPVYFTPDRDIAAKTFDLSKTNFILRLAELNAYHDTGVSGINEKFASEIIETLTSEGNLYITAERKLEPQFEKYRISIKPTEIHHAMYYADMYIGDSQTMAAEAAVLGTPSLRYNDFVGRLGYLEELESKWGLTYGIKAGNREGLLKKIKELLGQKELKKNWALKKNEMLKHNIDLNAYVVWLLENYPASVNTLKGDASFLNRFIINAN